MKPYCKRIGSILSISLVLAAAADAATYQVERMSASDSALITITLDEPSQEFRMPAWAPGDYEIFNYGNLLSRVAFSLDGKAAEAKKSASDPNLWVIPGGADEVVYRVKESAGNFSPNLRVKSSEIFVSGPGVLGWFKGHADEEQTLFVKQGRNETAYCALPAGENRAGYASYLAEDYDQLIDSPFVVGADVEVHTFNVAGKPHMIVSCGGLPTVDGPSWQSMVTPIVLEAQKLFGNLPYSRYGFICDFGGRGGGLEHKDSTRLGLFSRNPMRAQGLVAHEYVHTFNVKRIRPRSLGPFDYTKPAITGSLWWLEGVTDYYAEILLARSGSISRARLLNSMAQLVMQMNRSPAARRVTADEASRKVWQGRGSQGYGGLSYYQKGKAIGFCLDLAIRGHSGGKHSLDDVIRQLYEECQKGSGYTEGRIRELCVEFGGEKLGPIYDVSVLTTNPLPLEAVLKSSGFRLNRGNVIADASASSEKKVIGDTFPESVRG